jgi:hypothetical protein
VLRSHELHKNKIITKSITGEAIDIVDIGNWIVEPSKVIKPPVINVEETLVSQQIANDIIQDAIQDKQLEEKIEETTLPQPSTLYGELTDPIQILKLSIAEQLTMRFTQLLPAMNEMMIQANSNKRFSIYQENKILNRYYAGMLDALKETKIKIESGEGTDYDLYSLLEEFKKQGLEALDLSINEDNTSGSNYSRSYHEGLSAGYMSTVDVIEKMLSKEEQWRYKRVFTPEIEIGGWNA